MESTFVIGITFKNADITTRSAFSISAERQVECYNLAKELKFNDFVVLSTCNRTEIYGLGSVELAEQIITTVCNQPKELFDTYKFVKTSEEALGHIFQVASGLDSQILGDYEILGQFKNACKLSKENGLLGPVFERMANVCIQASKEIKTKTDLSKGTVSASYAAIEILKEKIGEKPTTCLLIGTGKFGNNISKNIKHYLPNFELTISNRTYATALDIAMTHGFSLLPYENIDENLQNFDVIILSTASEQYIVTPEHLVNSKIKLILDLSIPQTVHPDCKTNNKVEVLDIDTISAILDKSLANRKTYLPIANEIINAHIATFVDWNDFYKKRSQIVELKKMLIEASQGCPHLAKLEDIVKEEMVNKTIQSFVVSLKQNKDFKFEPEKILSKFMHYGQAN
ncbi:MAG: glutamyl-tRNA reductase [Bacteroidetes bacterium]|nr:glutamyl-tRNA reductase [Bacteroidota bacterium]